MPAYYDAHVCIGSDPSWKLLGLPVPFDAEAVVKLLDHGNMAGALVTPSGHDASDHFKSAHDAIAKGAKKYPARIFGMYRASPRRGQQTVDDLKRYVQESRFRAVLVNTSDDGITLDDRALIEPVIKAADDLKVPIMFEANEDNWDSCKPSKLAEVACDFPGVTFVIGRMGFGGVNGWPGFHTELLPAMQKASNTITETSGVFLSKFIQDLIDSVGVERVMTGSNAPYMPIELPAVMVQKHLNKMTQSQKDLVTGGNAKRVFGLN